MLIVQSTSTKAIPFYMVDSTDHIAAKTGLSPTVTISKNGAAFGAPAGAVTEIGSGWYKVAGNATDSNTLGALLVHATATGADPYDIEHEIIAFTVDSATVTLTSAYDPAKTAASPAQVQTELGTYGALRPTVATRTLDVSAGGEAGVDWANVGSPTTTVGLTNTTISTTQAVASVSGAVGSVTAGVTLTSAERTTLAGVIWNVLTSTLTTASSIGKLIVDNLNATVSSRAIPGDAMALTTGERTSTAAAIWNALTSGLTTVGSIGKLLVDNINATISSRSTYAGADTAGTTTLLSRIASALTITAGKVDVNDKTGFALTAGERSATADQVWDEVLSGHLTAGTTGAALNGAGAAGDPWGTSLPGSYGAGTAGNILGNRLDVAVSTRAAPGAAMTLTSAYDPAKSAASQASVDILDDYVDTEVSAIKSKTDQLSFGAGGVVADVTLDAADLQAIADAILKRDWTGISGEAAYSLLNAARMLRNSWGTAGGTLTVRKEDGTTTAWTRALSVDPTAQPIVGAT
jgi:hypothetical protein